MTAITLNLDDGARTLIDDWVRDGHYAAIEEGLADADAGRVHDAGEVFDRLIARYTAMAATR